MYYNLPVSSVKMNGDDGMLQVDSACVLHKELSESDWKGSWICIEKEKLKKLFPDEIFYFELVDFPLYLNSTDAEPVASITGILETGAHPVLKCLLTDSREILVPWIDNAVTLIKNQETGLIVKAVCPDFFDYDPERIG